MSSDTASEAKLRELIDGNTEANRTKWALEWKKQGKKVIGVLSAYVPEELVSAAGMLPWRVTGTWATNIVNAVSYRIENSCGYCSHVLESLLDGELDFLDGVVAADQDQDLTRLWDVWTYLKNTTFCHIIHVPFTNSELACQQLTKETRELRSTLEQFCGVKISEESIRDSIDTYNRTRVLLMKIYDLRKREIPPLSGAEVLGITTAAKVMPREQFNKKLETLLPYLERRTTSLRRVHPRLLVTSDMLDNPAYIRLIEEGCLVAMDDLDTASRYFARTVDASQADPVYALAKCYINLPNFPRMTSWHEQAQQVIKWVRDYDVDGVIIFPQRYCYPQMYRIPVLAEQLKEAAIPHITIEREYHLADVGQLRTRIGAFVELLEAKDQ